MSSIDNFFTTLDGTDKRTNIPSTISSPVWSGGSATLTAFYTGSTQSGSSGNYYYDVFNKVGSDSTREVQFAVAYGHFHGSGSLSTSAGNNPTKAIYRQFRNICLKNTTSATKFNFNANGDGTTYNADDIFVISVNRARYREKLDPGNWELHLSGSGDSETTFLKLIDDSGATADSSIKASERVFNVVSGSIAAGTTDIKTAAADENTTNGSYGLFYPDLGIIVLNATRLDVAPLSLGTSETANTNMNNAFKLVSASIEGEHFKARREEQIKSSHYFCRVRSDEYNWSQNPTYYSGDNAEVTNTTFIQDPKSYITTVGLYNDNNELLAVAKLSQPLLKSRDREAVIKVRLDF